MSARSWERKIRKNQAQINKQRKKRGEQPLSLKKDPNLDVYQGRSIAMPLFLVLFLTFFVVTSMRSADFDPTLWTFWTILVLYTILAVVLYFRRPFLAVGKDFVRTRRFTGDKNLFVSNIKSIVVSKGSVVIEPVKGTNWVFIRSLNLFPVTEMSERLQKFAEQHQISFTDNNK